MTVQESGLASCLVSGLALIVAQFALFALFAHIQHFSHHALMCMCVSAISAISATFCRSAIFENLVSAVSALSALSEKLISALSVSLKNQNFYIRKGKTNMFTIHYHYWKYNNGTKNDFCKNSVPINKTVSAYTIKELDMAFSIIRREHCCLGQSTIIFDGISEN